MIYEFQTLVCELTQMDVANASLYDGASALAEAAVLALRISPSNAGGASGRPRLLVSETIHPHARQVISTYISGFPCTLQIIPSADGVTDLEALRAALADDVAAVLMPQPNVFGCLEPVAQAAQAAQGVGALFIASVYPVSLGALSPPGAYGADIAVGEGRCLGSPVAYGGPGLGLMATTQALLRKIPGRLSGCTVDHAGRRAFTLTLQTREQHIRREKATSNICTNAGWLCVRATIFLSLLGAAGFKELARINAQKAHELFDRLTAIPWIRPVFDRPFFNEFAVRYTDGRTPEAVRKALLKAGILGGVGLKPWYPMLGDAVVWCATETILPDDMDRVVGVLRDL
jgi:glycine dehydrogenase subunit 1